MNAKLINDWEPETRALLEALTKAGFSLLRGDNGEYSFQFDGNLVRFIEDLTACDESHLYVKNPEGEERWLFLVYGNNPGELICDYNCDKALDAIIEKHYNDWDSRPQPKKPDPFQ